jgi:hypothetical protein
MIDCAFCNGDDDHRDGAPPFLLEAAIHSYLAFG